MKIQQIYPGVVFRNMKKLPTLGILVSYLPMTYSIKLLREILVPTATDYKGMYIGILLAISISLFAITQIVDICKEKKLKEKEN